MKFKSLSLLTVFLGSMLVVSTATAATASPSAPSAPSAQSFFTSKTCLDEVNAIAAEKGINKNQAARDASRLCSATITTTESAAVQATVAEVVAVAPSLNLNAADSQALVSAAAAGSVWTRLWTHTYWGGSLVEKHTGRTYWNGTHAWISSTTDSGYHWCHSEGGIAIGWSVTVLECTRPGAGSVADAFYRFDASVAYQGSPITLQVGLHHQTDRFGNVTAWQVGG
ncbi:hypothetical protein [Arthrobacter sp. M4]|uniref:hypothetical protein n=1 Tax=Arthrobacter sp. M4 TaxID=218160 RepID=UPI001CDC9E93|nr:hypothetical protein [Arthrobacter sp. M4]MCA4133387.1 hypothetical protein [Arthrobacter sp. M4]